MGYGGCPMAKDELTGNMPTEKILSYFKEKDIDLGLNEQSITESLRLTTKVFL